MAPISNWNIESHWFSSLSGDRIAVGCKGPRSGKVWSRKKPVFRCCSGSWVPQIQWWETRWHSCCCINRPNIWNLSYRSSSPMQSCCSNRLSVYCTTRCPTFIPFKFEIEGTVSQLAGQCTHMPQHVQENRSLASLMTENASVVHCVYFPWQINRQKGLFTFTSSPCQCGI